MAGGLELQDLCWIRDMEIAGGRFHLNLRKAICLNLEEFSKGLAMARHRYACIRLSICSCSTMN